MPRQPTYLTSRAVIAKSEIAVYAVMQGKLHFGADITIDGTKYAPLSVVFVTFAGEIGDDGLYHGVYQFREAEPSDEGTPTADLTTLPNGDKPRRTKTKNESEAT